MEAFSNVKVIGYFCDFLGYFRGDLYDLFELLYIGKGGIFRIFKSFWLWSLSGYDIQGFIV